MSRSRSVMMAVLLAFSAPLSAFEFDWGGLSLDLSNRVTLGAGWRIEDRDEDLLAKLNVPGQQELCTEDDCLSLSGDPAPIRRLVNARGGFSHTNTDNGNMNYDKYDMVSALARLDTKLTFSYGEIFGKVTGIGYLDHINHDFDQVHFNTRWQARTSKRSKRVERRFARNAEFREYFVGGVIPIGSQELNLTVGHQRLRWGEANLHLFNTLDFINPLDAGLARMPGLDLSSIYTPVGLAIAGMDLSDTLSLEFFYQYAWEAVRPDPAGSFLSTNDVAGSGDYAILGLGQFSEDPDRLYVSNGAASLISQATRTVYPLAEDYGYPEDGGQFGLKLSWYAENFLDGTEFAFHAANYHSRLPYGSALASEKSCTRDAAIPGDLPAALVACGGFNGSINSSGQGKEPLPVDTIRVFLDYPEDIRLVGVSFNSNLGDWSLAGEYTFYDDMPLQVLQSDLIFTAAQNAAPEEDIPIGPFALGNPIFAGLPAPMQEVVAALQGQLPSTASTVLPGARSVFPALLTEYRGRIPDPGEYVPGYERFQMGQFALTGIRIFSSSNPFKADQIIWAVEAGFTHVVDMPAPHVLPLQGAGDFTHPTPGSDGTGQPEGEPINTLSINPTQMTKGFADDFSWGLRTLIRMQYNDVLGSGFNLFPTLIWFEDIDGISPSPMQNYVAGRRLMAPALFVEFSQALSASVVYQYHDGDLTNTVRDRDNIAVSMSYNF